MIPIPLESPPLNVTSNNRSMTINHVLKPSEKFDSPGPGDCVKAWSETQLGAQKVVSLPESGDRLNMRVLPGCCTHIHVLGDGAQMLGFPCLNRGDDEKNLLGWRSMENVNFEVTRPGTDIVSVLRPTENVLQVTRPGSDVIFSTVPKNESASAVPEDEPSLPVPKDEPSSPVLEDEPLSGHQPGM
ncbi:hypothetical protein Tco_1504853 [Tanacetum coccineum]